MSHNKAEMIARDEQLKQFFADKILHDFYKNVDALDADISTFGINEIPQTAEEAIPTEFEHRLRLVLKIFDKIVDQLFKLCEGSDVHSESESPIDVTSIATAVSRT